jgi:hypothetical protein
MFSVNWFDKWHFSWCCSESSWKTFSAKLRSPMRKGLSIGTSLAIGVSSTVYVIEKYDYVPHNTKSEEALHKHHSNPAPID